MRLEGRPLLDVDLSLTNAQQTPVILQMAAFFVGPQGPQGPPLVINSLDELGNLQDGDQLLVERGTDQHKLSAEDMKQFLGLPVRISDSFDKEHEL